MCHFPCEKRIPAICTAITWKIREFTVWVPTTFSTLLVFWNRNQNVAFSCMLLSCYWCGGVCMCQQSKHFILSQLLYVCVCVRLMRPIVLRTNSTMWSLQRNDQLLSIFQLPYSALSRGKYESNRSWTTSATTIMFIRVCMCLWPVSLMNFNSSTSVPFIQPKPNVCVCVRFF